MKWKPPLKQIPNSGYQLLLTSFGCRQILNQNILLRIVAAGTYNLFLGELDRYSAKAEDFESSGIIFHEAFPNGFLWEVIEVLAGPPNVTFKWRHWGTFSGAYKEHQPTGEVVEVCWY